MRTAAGPRASGREEELLARRVERRSGATRTAPRSARQVRGPGNDGIIPVLARSVRDVEADVQRGTVAHPSWMSTWPALSTLKVLQVLSHTKMACGFVTLS